MNEIKCPIGGPEGLEGCGSVNVVYDKGDDLYDCLDCGLDFIPGTMTADEQEVSDELADIFGR